MDLTISVPSPTVASNGTIKWVVTTTGPIRSTVALGADGTLYFGTRDGVFYAMNPDGTEKWTFKAGDEIRASAAIDVLSGTIYFGSYDSKLYALNLDGTLRWSFATDGFIEGSPIIDSRGGIYVKPHGGSLYAINRNGTLKNKRIYNFRSSGMAFDAKGVLYFCGDFVLFAVGPVQPPPPPIPQNPVGELSVNKDVFIPGDTLNITATLTNATAVTRVVELKVYMRNSRQDLVPIVDIPSVSLKPGETHSKLVYSHTFAVGEASTIIYIGARVMIPETGDTVSIDFKTVSFQGQ